MAWTIITQPNCPACQKAKETLEVYDRPYEQYDITEYKHKFMRNMMKWSGLDTVPQIWNHEGDYIGGYKELMEYGKD